MGDIEQELREAMNAAVVDERPPPNLIEAIRRRHRWHTVRVAAFGAVLVVAVFFIASAATVALRGGHATGVRPASSPPVLTPTRTPRAAAGTELFTCGSGANTYGDLGSDWQRRSLRAGPLWFVGARDFASTDRSINPLGNYRQGFEMIIVVKPNTTVWVTVPARARPYIQFGRSALRSGGGHGITFVSCPAVPTNPGMMVAPDGTTQFGVGTIVAAPRCVPLDVGTSASRRPVRVMLSFAAGACPAGT
jgi:hypothetical protein